MVGIRIGLAGASANPLTGAVAPELASLMPASVKLLAYPSRAPVFPHTPLDRAIQVLGHVEAAQRAETEGCDAVVVDSFGDYGLDILRSGLGVPVVGCGDAALEEAARLGRTFALVTTWPVSMDFIVKRVLRDSGLEAACRGVLSIGVEENMADVSQPGGYLSRIAAGEASILNRLKDVCRDAIERNGAEVIVLGCTCLSAVAETLSRDCPVPVVNPRLAGVRSALRQAAQGGPRAKPSFRAESLDVLKNMLDAVADTPPEACPACVSEHPDPQSHPSRGA